MQMDLVYYLTATLLGGMHALEPGHGKTVVAAYLVGSRGKKIDAVLLGMVVTFTHTFTVIIMAVVAKMASERISITEESLHGYLGTTAGLLILIVGAWMLSQRIRGKDPLHFHLGGHGHSHHHHHNTSDHSHDHSHDHPHDHHHNHHDHGDHHHGEDHHHHDHGHVHDKGTAARSYWQLLILGISGGVVPCPAAIAILLAAIATGRLGEGLTYILLFSLGLASVLIAIGIAVVSAGKLAGRFLDSRLIAKRISLASACLITLVGVVTLASSVRHLV